MSNERACWLMATIQRFEDLQVWQIGRELVKRMYGLTDQGGLAKDFGLKDQMRRAAVSICSNIAEGFERDGGAEFVQFLSHAKGSCGELRSQLYHVSDLGYAESPEVAALQNECAALSGKLSRLIAHIRSSPYKGTKFKPNPPG